MERLHKPPGRSALFSFPGFAYVDGSGLRPMTELEFKKICRGGGTTPAGIIRDIASMHYWARPAVPCSFLCLGHWVLVF